MNAELKEWLGLKPADFLVYAAMAAIGGMYWSQNLGVDVIFCVVAIGLCGQSCRWGMPPEKELSAFSNAVKRFAYPLCLCAAIVASILNFVRWNR